MTSNALSFPFATPPAPGEIHEVAPGVGWLRMPLPTVLNHINLWILRGADGVTLVDTGMPTDETKAIWEDIFAGPLKGERIERIICTHHHPDHMGAVSWLAQRTGAPPYATEGEWGVLRTALSADRAATGDKIVTNFARAGLPPDSARELIEMRMGLALLGTVPERAELLDPDAPLAAADTTWKVMIGLGHSAQLAALYASELGVVISSDQVLPGISPNVSVPITDVDPASNPLGLYLDTLRPFRALPEDTLVLPSHKLPFYGVRSRVDDLTAHHMERLDDVRGVCANGATAAEVMGVMFRRRLTGPQVFMALGETLAHLHYLMATGEVVREPGAEIDIYRSR